MQVDRAHIQHVSHCHCLAFLKPKLQVMADSVSEEIINKNNNKDQADAACSKPKHNNNNSIDNDQNRHVPNDSPMPNGSDDQQQNVANELGEEFDVGDQAEDEDDDIDDEANANDDDEDNYDDYYTNTEFDFAESCEQQCDLQQDPEYFDYKVVNKNQLLEHLEQMVEQLAQRLNMNKSVAKVT